MSTSTIPPVHQTLEGEALDLSGLSEREWAFYGRMAALAMQNTPWATFQAAYMRPDSPLWHVGCDPAAPLLANEAVLALPLYRAISDMWGRLGVNQGLVRPNP